MKQLLLLSGCFLGMLFFSACEQTFNTVLNVDVEHTPMIALNIANRGGFGEFVGTVAGTRPITGPAQSNTNLPDARILVYENGILKDSLLYQSLDQIYSSTQFNWLNGATYQLVASAPGKKTVDATDVMPLRIEPENIVRIHNAKSFTIPEMDNATVLCDEVSFTFKDPGAAKNYYSFDFLIGGGGGFGHVGVICNDADVQNEVNDNDPSSTNALRYGTLYLDDLNFNGQTKKITLYVPSNPGGIDPYNLIFTHLSESSYKYSRTFSLYQDTQGNPFSEPVQVYSNVKNGAGIFGLKQSVEKQL